MKYIYRGADADGRNLQRPSPCAVLIPLRCPQAKPDAGGRDEQQQVAAIDKLQKDKGEEAQGWRHPDGGEELFGAVGRNGFVARA